MYFYLPHFLVLFWQCRPASPAMVEGGSFVECAGRLERHLQEGGSTSTKERIRLN